MFHPRFVAYLTTRRGVGVRHGCRRCCCCWLSGPRPRARDGAGGFGARRRARRVVGRWGGWPCRFRSSNNDRANVASLRDSHLPPELLTPVMSPLSGPAGSLAKDATDSACSVSWCSLTYPPALRPRVAHLLSSLLLLPRRTAERSALCSSRQQPYSEINQQSMNGVY